MMAWYGDVFKRQLNNQAIELVSKCGFFVEAEAKRMCPVDTGNLRASIHTKLDTRDLSVLIGTDEESLMEQVRKNPLTRAKAGTRVWYALAVEFGTARQRPQPYLRPALDALKYKLKEVLR